MSRVFAGLADADLDRPVRRTHRVFADGRVVDLTEGTLFYIPPEPHDSWVVGDSPYVSIHLLGAAKYAT